MEQVNRRLELETGLKLLEQRLAGLHQAIETLKQAQPLRADAVARLEMYEQNERRLSWERDKLERDREDLVLQEYERAECA